MNSLLAILVTLFGIVTLASPVQLANAPSPILVTLFGIVTFVRPEQPLNALLAILVTLFGIVTLVRPEQPENELLPMLVTLFGIVTLVTFANPQNVFFPIDVTPFSITTDVICSQTSCHGRLLELLYFAILPFSAPSVLLTVSLPSLSRVTVQLPLVHVLTMAAGSVATM